MNFRSKLMRLKVHSHIAFLAPANEVWGKVIFSQMFVCPQGRGVSFPACITGHITRRGLPLGRLSPGGQTPFRAPWDTMGYCQQAGGTHPTGMHSCSECDCIFKSNYWRSQSHNLNSYHWHPYNTFHAIWENPVAPKKIATCEWALKR